MTIGRRPFRRVFSMPGAEGPALAILSRKHERDGADRRHPFLKLPPWRRTGFWPCTHLRQSQTSDTGAGGSFQELCGTRSEILTVAFFRTWRGSNTLRCATPSDQHSLRRPAPFGPGLNVGIHPRLGGLRVQGTASSPASTTKLAEREGFEPSSGFKGHYAISNRAP